jgi:fatty-acyl-CoA synthase
MLGIGLAGAEVFLLDESEYQARGAQIFNEWKLMGLFDSEEFRLVDAPTLTKDDSKLLDFDIDCYEAFFSVLSSGTTGKPKAITHSYSSVLGSARDFSQSLGANGVDVFLHNWPMHYMAGIFNLFLCPIATGSSIHVGDKFSAHTARSQLAEISSLKNSRILASPTMLSLLSRVKSSIAYNLSSLDIVCTSSILYPTIAAKFCDLFSASIRPCYGITEFGGSFTLGTNADIAYSVGSPTPNVEIELRNNEIFVKTPHVAKTIEFVGGEVLHLSPSSFHGTNDLGHFSVRGELCLTGRTGELIKKGGEFLSLIEVENCALSIDGVVDVLAVPCGSEFWGQDYQLKLVLRETDNDSLESISARVSAALVSEVSPRAKPMKIDIETSLPRTGSGKPLRRHYLV